TLLPPPPSLHDALPISVLGPRPLGDVRGAPLGGLCVPVRHDPAAVVHMVHHVIDLHRPHVSLRLAPSPGASPILAGGGPRGWGKIGRATSELQSRENLV